MENGKLKYGIESKGPPYHASSSAGGPSSGPVSFGDSAKRLFRKLAAVVESVFAVNWVAFVIDLGYKEDDIDASLKEPTSKIFKILQIDASKYNADIEQWWQGFLKKITTFGNEELTTKLKDVYNEWNQSVKYTDSGEFSNIYPPLHSNVDGKEQEYDNHNVTLDRPELSMEINVVAEALDRVSHNPATAEITKWLRDGVPRILRLERELKSLKTMSGISDNEIREHKRLELEMKSKIEHLKQTVDDLRDENTELKKTKQDEQLHGFDYVTRKEAQDIKDEEKIKKLEKQRTAPEGDTAEAYREENIKLKMEVTSLKKQIDEIVKVNHSWDDHYKTMKRQLEKQAIDLRKELDDLLAVRNENDQLKTESARHLQEIDVTQKEKDAMLLQAKERIERLETEKIQKQREVDALRQKFEKVQGYARTLTNQRKEAEDEISRLNEALAQQLRVSSAEVQKGEPPQLASKIAIPPEPLYESIPSGLEDSIASISLQAPQKRRVESMSEGELREELELLRQQTELYRSDFQHERQDRQRVMGELDELKKELKKHQRELKTSRPQVKGSKQQRQVLEDAQYAQELQRREEEAYKYRPKPQVAQPRYQPRPQEYYPQQRAKQNYYTVEDIKALQTPNKGLVPHGGQGGYMQQGYQYYGPPPNYGRSRNYAANDMVIDGNQVIMRGRLEMDGEGGDDDETDGAPGQTGQDDDDKEDNSNENTCPRCKRSFSQDTELTVHLDRCLTD